MRRVDPHPSQHSRYAALEVRRRVAGRRLPRLELGPRILLTEATNAQTWSYRVQEGDRIDRLAAALLGDSRLWWVLADLNPELRDALSLTIGGEIRVPNEELLAGLGIE